VGTAFIGGLGRMTKTLYLIAEAYKDVLVMRQLLTKKGFSGRIQPINTPKKGSVSQLAQQLEKSIAEAQERQQAGDCVVVLHDADELTRPTGRQDYDRIEAICQKYPTIIHLQARDELEAWLVADSGLCQWLNQKAQNRDHAVQPSKLFETWLNAAKKPKWNDSNLDAILKHAAADGDQHSPPMRQALQQLADCL
jgi:hypothetical protein